MENESPTLAETIYIAIDSKLINLNTCMPGIVEKYDPVAKRADIQPSIKKKYTADGEVVSLPVIPNVPMCFMQTRTSIISVPVKVGDDILIIFSERSIDNWKSGDGGAQIDPLDIRKFDLSDAFAIPICKPLGTGVPAEGEPIYVKNIDSIGRFHENGQIKLENPIAYVDIKANGDIEVKNDICTGTFFNSGLIEFKNAVSTYTMEAAGTSTLTNSIGTIIENISGLLSLSNAGGSITIAPSGTVTFTTPSGSGEFKSDGSFQFNGAGGEKIAMSTAGVVEIGGAAATTVNFGAGSEPILKGVTATGLYAIHTHVAPGGGGTTTPPSNSLAGALSAKVNTE